MQIQGKILREWGLEETAIATTVAICAWILFYRDSICILKNLMQSNFFQIMQETVYIGTLQAYRSAWPSSILISFIISSWSLLPNEFLNTFEIQFLQISLKYVW